MHDFVRDRSLKLARLRSAVHERGDMLRRVKRLAHITVHQVESTDRTLRHLGLVVHVLRLMEDWLLLVIHLRVSSVGIHHLL